MPSKLQIQNVMKKRSLDQILLDHSVQCDSRLPHYILRHLFRSAQMNLTLQLRRQDEAHRSAGTAGVIEGKGQIYGVFARNMLHEHAWLITYIHAEDL